MQKVVGVVLAAGFGSRLKPATNFKPKPLIPVAGVEPLFFAISNFEKAGIRRIVVNTHYLPEQVTQAVQRWKELFGGIEIRCIVEGPEILGTGGALINIVKSFPDWFHDSAMLVQNGDTLAGIDLLKLLKIRNDESSFAVSFFEPHIKRYNPLWVGISGRWSGIGKTAPKSGDRPAHFLGVHLLSRPAVKEMGAECFESKPADLFNAIYRPLTERNHVIQSVDCFSNNLEQKLEKAFWFDMTTSEYLLEAQRYMLSADALRMWSQILQQRYPNIKEVKAGFWALGAIPKNFEDRVRSPVVFINADNVGLTEQAFDFSSLGPDATIVIEEFAGDKSFLLPNQCCNSVVMVSSNPGLVIEDPAKVENTVLIV
jgi:NDP-sugar pyrophosphorylase family protein